MTENATTIDIPRGWIVGFCVAGAVVGCGAAFIVAPVVEWLLSLIGDAPGPLRIAALLPLAWAIPVLTLAGAIGGFLLTSEWRKEVSVVTVSSEGVIVESAGAKQYVARDQIAEVFGDGKDLVIADRYTNELSRSRTDGVLLKRLQRAFEEFGYPWGGTDPYESSYVAWIDGRGDVDDRVNDLLRTRHRALADKRMGAAEDVRDELRALGVVVRDLDDAQQYRDISRPPSQNDPDGAGR